MGINFRTMITISDGFRDILKRQRYEELVLTTINRSHVLIKNLPLSKVTDQSNNEPDYLDSVGNKYEVKLLLDKQQGALIGERKNDLQNWINSMMKECGEFNDCVQRREIANVRNTKLYEILKSRLSSVRTDEVAIIFSLYPVVKDYRCSVFMHATTDFLQAVVDEMKENINSCREVYFLYPSMEKGILVLRNAKTREREYIPAPEITDYISYDIVPIIE